MDWISKYNAVALTIMVAITLLNIVLGINFLNANGRALAAVFTGQTIFLLAGVELVAVLMTYVISKHRPIIPPPRADAPAM